MSLADFDHDAFQRRLLEAMIAVRKAAGVRQIDLAARLGKPQSYVSKVEGRERRLDVGEYVRWMQALRCDPATHLSVLIAELKHCHISDYKQVER
jgi:transcriptional regulator with XRE-family HTH domain